MGRFLPGNPLSVWVSVSLWGRLSSLVAIFAALSLHPKIPFLADLGATGKAFDLCHMLVRPRDLGNWMSNERQLTLTLPLEAARSKAREILNQPSQGGFTPVIEKWRQLPDGQIEFSIRHIRAPD
jgi:hypothetical protein